MAAESRQDLLRQAWHGGRAGTLSASAQARVWAIREEWRDVGSALHNLAFFDTHHWLADRVHVIGLRLREPAWVAA